MDNPHTQDLIPRLPNSTLYKGKLIIFTTFYQQQAHSRYTQSLVATAMVLERIGIKWDYWPIHGDFHVERACNGALAAFLEDEEATDILIIDSDEAWDVMAVLRLLAHKEEVVACAYRMKNAWEKYTCVLKSRNGNFVGKVLGDGTALLQAERIPGGFLRIKKSAAKKFADNCGDNWYWDAEKKIPAFFMPGIRDHVFFSHDFDLSMRWKELGVDLWIDPNADINHYGMTEYVGNLDKWLKKAFPLADQEEKDEEAFEIIRNMANG